MHNSIEKARPRVAKVTCFIEPLEGSADPPDLLQQYRRWCSEPLQIPGGSVIGFPYMYITMAICPSLGADVDKHVIFDVQRRRNTINKL